MPVAVMYSSLTQLVSHCFVACSLEERTQEHAEYVFRLLCQPCLSGGGWFIRNIAPAFSLFNYNVVVQAWWTHQTCFEKVPERF